MQSFSAKPDPQNSESKWATKSYNNAFQGGESIIEWSIKRWCMIWSLLSFQLTASLSHKAEWLKRSGIEHARPMHFFWAKAGQDNFESTRATKSDNNAFQGRGFPPWMIDKALLYDVILTFIWLDCFAFLASSMHSLSAKAKPYNSESTWATKSYHNALQGRDSLIEWSIKRWRMISSFILISNWTLITEAPFD
jgi:hypothetical protein